jgi:hypothetical protein
MPEAPRELHDRIRAALDAEDRRATAGRFRRWSGVAAVAVAAAALLFIVLPAGADVPRLMRDSADVHTRLCAPGAGDCLSRSGAQVMCPARECICARVREMTGAPWILYRRTKPLSLLVIADDGAPLPARARRMHGDREYHAFSVGPNTVLCLRVGGLCHVWIGALDEHTLLEAALSTTEGRRAFAGEKLSVRDVACSACCGGQASVELLIAGQNLQIERVMQALREAR